MQQGVTCLSCLKNSQYKLKIVENKKNPKQSKNQNKLTSMAKAMGPFRDLQAPSLLSGPRKDVPTEPLSHRP
jgi:hypothetical protein